MSVWEDSHKMIRRKCSPILSLASSLLSSYNKFSGCRRLIAEWMTFKNQSGELDGIFSQASLSNLCARYHSHGGTENDKDSWNQSLKFIIAQVQIALITKLKNLHSPAELATSQEHILQHPFHNRILWWWSWKQNKASEKIHGNPKHPQLAFMENGCRFPS